MSLSLLSWPSGQEQRERSDDGCAEAAAAAAARRGASSSPPPMRRGGGGGRSSSSEIDIKPTPSKVCVDCPKWDVLITVVCFQCASNRPCYYVGIHVSEKRPAVWCPAASPVSTSTSSLPLSSAAAASPSRVYLYSVPKWRAERSSPFDGRSIAATHGRREKRKERERRGGGKRALESPHSV